MTQVNSKGGRRGRGREAPAASASPMFDRQPPQSLEAEMSLLGAMILDHNVIGDVLGMLSGPDDFYKEAHAHIYRAIVDIYDVHHSGDLVQLQNMLRDRGVYEQCGGDDYLVTLANSVPAATSAPHFARIVGEKAKLRRLIDAAGQILYDAYHVGDLGPEGAREVLDKAEMSVFEIAQESGANDPQALADLLEIEMRRIEAMDFDGESMSGVRSGYHEMDELLRGFQPGELIIMAARPSMGKTALALNIAEQMAIGGVPVPGAKAGHRTPVALFSLEMSKNAIVQRMMSARGQVSSMVLRGGSRIPDEDLRRLMLASEDLKQAPIYVDDTPGLTVLTLRARARRMVRQYGVKAIMIDYLQLMTAPHAAKESRQVEVSAISRGVKALARELKVPVICLSQLNRGTESREGNRPRMSDLRESGSIEQDADVIMLLHREEYYHVSNPEWALDNPDKVGLAEIIIAKQRNGPTGVVKLVWDSRTTRFKNFDSHAHAPGGYAAPAHASPFAQPQGTSAPSTFSEPKGTASSWTKGPSEPPPFSPGKKSGPVNNFRDGGGPDADDDLGDLPI